MHRRPVASLGFVFAALAGLILTPSCGGGGGAQTDQFVGPWTFSSGTLVPMCPLAGLTLPNFNLMGLNVTFAKVDASTISLTLNAGCVVKFQVSGNKATVAANQTCSLDVGPPLGTVSIDITTWALTLTGNHIDSMLSGTASLCSASGTAVLVHGTTDGGVRDGGGGGHGGAGTTGSAGVGGGSGTTGTAGTDGGAGTGGSAGSGGSTDGSADVAADTGAADTGADVTSDAPSGDSD